MTLTREQEVWSGGEGGEKGELWGKGNGYPDVLESVEEADGGGVLEERWSDCFFSSLAKVRKGSH